MGGILWTWIKGVVALPLNLTKAADANQRLAVEHELAETKARLSELEDESTRRKVELNGRVPFYGKARWLRDTEGTIEDVPYCPRCYDADGKLIHLIITPWEGDPFGIAKCLNCKSTIYELSRPKSTSAESNHN